MTSESLTRSNNQLASEKEQLASEKGQLASEKGQLASEKEQLASEKEQMVSKNKELKKGARTLRQNRQTHRNVQQLLDGAGNGAVGNPPEDPDAGSKTTQAAPRRRQKEQLQREGVSDIPGPSPLQEAGRPRRDHVVHETMTADELACRKCRFRPTPIQKDHRGSGGSSMAGDILGHTEVLQKMPQAAGGPDRRRCQTSINVAQTVTLRCMIDSFEKIRKIFHMFHGVLIPRSTQPLLRGWPPSWIHCTRRSGGI